MFKVTKCDFEERTTYEQRKNKGIHLHPCIHIHADRRIFFGCAEIERENIRIQTMEGRMQKAREGKWNGGFAPYGYQLVDGIHEAIILEEVWEQAQVKVAAKAKKRSILSDKISGDNIYKALVFFDRMYDNMNEAERREFIEQLMEKVEVCEER